MLPDNIPSFDNLGICRNIRHSKFRTTVELSEAAARELAFQDAP
jgi:hypothetical protein